MLRNQARDAGAGAPGPTSRAREIKEAIEILRESTRCRSCRGSRILNRFHTHYSAGAIAVTVLRIPAGCRVKFTFSPTLTPFSKLGGSALKINVIMRAVCRTPRLILLAIRHRHAAAMGDHAHDRHVNDRARIRRQRDLLEQQRQPRQQHEPPTGASGGAKAGRHGLTLAQSSVCCRWRPRSGSLPPGFGNDVSA